MLTARTCRPQGDIRSYHKSYRRPESGGPKQYVDGRSMRALDTDMHWQTDGYCGRVRGSPGPGHYDAETSRDRTQSRRLQQPVIANYKRGHTKKAECLSITLLTGHHWKEKVPQLGNGIADAAGQAPRHPSNRRDGFTEDPTRGSSEYRRQQVDWTWQRPKIPRLEAFGTEMLQTSEGRVGHPIVAAKGPQECALHSPAAAKFQPRPEIRHPKSANGNLPVELGMGAPGISKSRVWLVCGRPRGLPTCPCCLGKALCPWCFTCPWSFPVVTARPRPPCTCAEV